jgi:serine/threonine protein kinase
VSPPPDHPPGYRLRRLVGSGRTAHVYEADNPAYGTVALKLPRDELARDPMLQRMFENEVQMTLALSHPRIVAALAGYPTGAGAYLALEFCEGSLDAALGTQVPLEVAYRLTLDVAQGLAHSHERGILHRDVKPANVFIRAGRAKLGDFGTGFFIGDAFSGETQRARVGTAFYMAPEMFQGESASPKSDLYSLGVLAYELIAGARPFTGQTADELMLAHTSGVPLSLRHHRPEVSPEISRVVTTAMAYDPDKRYGSVRAFVLAFATATGLPPDDPPPAFGRSSRLPHPPLRPDGAEVSPTKPPPKRRFGWLGRWRS